MDSSQIDDSTLQDRDWYWAFNGLWDKKSAERCRATIADTIICSGGEPQQWMFTAKVRKGFQLLGDTWYGLAD